MMPVSWRTGYFTCSNRTASARPILDNMGSSIDLSQALGNSTGGNIDR